MNLLSSLHSILQGSMENRKERTEAEPVFALKERIGRTSRAEFEEEERTSRTESEEAGRARPDPHTNLLAKGDNLAFMEYLANTRGMRGKIDMIYIDPPFCSGANYKAVTRVKEKETGASLIYTQEAYEDKWSEGADAYLRMVTERLIIMRELLSEEGCIYIHLDWHIVHYVKVLADVIFGAQNFLNEIIWHYKSGGAGKRHFGRKHDTILLYAKSKKYCFYPQKEKSYNRDMQPYHFKGVQEFQDRAGWYTLVNMRDVWPIDMVGRTSGERVDYATQKPEALLERMVQSCTKPGSICADFFAGSGTLAAVAEKLGRQWICCDNGGLAIARIQKRLCRKNSVFDYYEEQMPPHHPVCGQTGNNTDRLVTVHASLDPDGGKGDMKLSIELEPKKEHVVDHWSIDYDFERVYRPQEHFFRDKKGMQLKAEKRAEGFKRICVKITDIMGNTHYEVVPF